jgi:hypothetical protein
MPCSFALAETNPRDPARGQDAGPGGDTLARSVVRSSGDVKPGFHGVLTPGKPGFTAFG